MEINGKNYTLKYGLRSMFIWEEMMDRPFEIKTLMDTYVFCYACLVANNENPKLEFNEFIDYCDGHNEVIGEFNEFMSNELKQRDVLSNKKKVTRGEKNSQ